MEEEKHYCLCCGAEIPKYKKFCNRSCAAKYNNVHRTRKPWTEEQKQKRRIGVKQRHCKYCNKELDFGERSVCSECRKYGKTVLYDKLGISEGSLKHRYEEALRTLKKLYFEDQLSSLEIYKLTGVNFRTLRDLFKDNNISTRNLSDSVRLAIEKGKVDPISCPKYIHGYHITWENRKVFYRSSYELQFAKLLDTKKISYQMESLRIRYFDSQKNVERIAIPDFYLPETNEIVEIKSNYTLNIQEMNDKFKAYRKAGYLPKLLLNGDEIVL